MGDEQAEESGVTVVMELRATDASEEARSRFDVEESGDAQSKAYRGEALGLVGVVGTMGGVAAPTVEPVEPEKDEGVGAGGLVAREVEDSDRENPVDESASVTSSGRVDDSDSASES